MANETYFKNFNVIQYGNSTSNSAVVDITERVVNLQNVQNNPYVFYPLDITDGTRADQIANINFNDPYSSWVLYLSNDIIDPYYEWYLTQDQFNEFINTKYGSLANAQQTIAFWRNNWVDQPTLTPSQYASEIAGNSNRIKYWTPNVGPTGAPISYSRNQVDWVVSTNQIIDVQTTSANGFIVNEIVHIPSSNGTATGQVVQTSNTNVIVQNILSYSGTLNTSGNMHGTESTTNAVYTAITYTANTITADEFAYWTPVYYYDMENEKNEGNRTIRVMQPNYVPSYIRNVKNLLK